MSSQDQATVAEYSKTWPTKPGHYVYRLWGYDGTPLYVGRAGEIRPKRVNARLAAHRRQRPWWPEVDEERTDVATFDSAAEVVEEEPRQVAALSPKYNTNLRGRCCRGHDVSAPDARESGGGCKRCLEENAADPAVKARKVAYERARSADPAVKARIAAYNADPAVKARKAAYMAAYNADTAVRAKKTAWERTRRRRPYPGQEGLWA